LILLSFSVVRRRFGLSGDATDAKAAAVVDELRTRYQRTEPKVVHEQAGGFYAFLPFVFEGKIALRESFHAMLERLGNLVLTLDLQCRAVGPTGCSRLLRRATNSPLPVRCRADAALRCGAGAYMRSRESLRSARLLRLGRYAGNA
jgi:hypothetical protein